MSHSRKRRINRKSFSVLDLIAPVTNRKIYDRNIRMQEKDERDAQRQKKLEDREQINKYLVQRESEVKKLNDELKECISDLKSILNDAIEMDQTVWFEVLKSKEEKYPDLELPTEYKQTPKFVSREEYFSRFPKPSLFDTLLYPRGTDGYNKLVQEGEILYKEYENRYEEYKTERKKNIEQFTKEYETERINFIEQNSLEIKYRNGDLSTIEQYCSMILERTSYPNGFPQKLKLAYLPEPKELVVEYELPIKKIVPTVTEYIYIKNKDQINEKSRKIPEIREIYQEVIASICLRSLYELFEADLGNHIDVIVFNGFVKTFNPATGKDIQPCLISIRTTKESLKEINLTHIDKRICLQNLGAQISPQPDELIAVKPLLEFDMVDKRFIENSDVISELDSRPNIMELNPYEFENLVNNLFSKIGFEAKLTRSSRDGGIDVVAFDARPILGGKVVIQAKRYKNVVGVSAVRDLYGSMINEGASKGILVTTSHYGSDAYKFAENKPIELIDGGGLLYLLNQNGVKARIIFPKE